MNHKIHIFTYENVLGYVSKISGWKHSATDGQPQISLNKKKLQTKIFTIQLHAISSYKKRSYKKRLVEFMKHKKCQLVDIRIAEKRVSKPN